MPPETKILDNSEIDQALKEFEAKSALEQAQKVAKKDPEVVDVPKMVRLVMKLSGGTIKEQRDAEYVLFAFFLVIVGVSLYLFLK